ncbi:MAG: DUF4097 domain-containing protein [Oscillochloris sp.]|nr:DUF4097 domain-containing protein [Oscillochloris sp.]
METETRPVDTPNEPYYRGGNQTRRWGGLLVLAGVIWLVFALVGRGPLFGFGFGTTERSAVIPAATYDVTAVRVIGVNDNIRLIGWSGEAVQLTGTRYGYGWNAGAAGDALEAIDVVVKQDGDQLLIEVQREPGLQMFAGRSPYAVLELSVPAGVAVSASTVNGEISGENVRGDLQLESINGEIEVDGIIGNVSLNTTNGDVELSALRGALTSETISGDLSASGDIRGAQIATVNGTVELQGASGTIEINSINGDIVLEDLHDAVLNIESTNGDIVLEGSLARTGESGVSNISGDIEAELSAPDGITFAASTVSGELQSDLELRERNEGRRALSGVIGEGAATLRLNTTSGDISLAE